MHPQERPSKIKVKTEAKAPQAPFAGLVILLVIVLLLGAVSGM